jgi:hypothetical protein
MIYPPCPHWAGWYRPWTPPPMHFHPRWSGLAESFGHGGYYTRDGRYKYVGHQQDRRASGHENWIVQNAKLDHPVSPKTVAAPTHRHKQEAPKDRSSVDEPGTSQGRTWSRSETSASDEAKPDMEKSLEGVAAEQDRVSEAKVETKTEVGISS